MINTRQWICALLVLMSFSIFAVGAVNALGNITVNMDVKTGDSIKWSWEYDSTISGASLDGEYLPYFDVMSTSYIAKDLSPFSVHTFKIYNTTEFGENTTITDRAIATEQEIFFSTINLYIFLIFGIICLVFGAGIPLIGYIGVVFGIIGWLGSLQNSFIMGLLFVIVIIIGLVEGLSSI